MTFVNKQLMDEKLYRRLRKVARFLLALFFPIRVEGLENIPGDGPVMLCSNHISLIDPIFMAVAVGRPIHYMGKKELWGSKLLAKFFAKMGAFPVDRGGSDMGALRNAMEVLKSDGVLGIYPQGHRYRRDEVRHIETGAALIALRSRANVIPVHVTSPLRVFRRTHIRFGAPVKLADLAARINSEALTQATSRIADGIWQETNEI